MRNSHLLSMQLMKYNVYTLEHLMPQKWMANWSPSEEGNVDWRMHLVRTLGNCIMITLSLNSTISNEQWNVKLEGKNNKGGLKAYANGLLTLDGVLTLNEWNEECIIERSKQLAQKACRVWVA